MEFALALIRFMNAAPHTKCASGKICCLLIKGDPPWMGLPTAEALNVTQCFWTFYAKMIIGLLWAMTSTRSNELDQTSHCRRETRSASVPSKAIWSMLRPKKSTTRITKWREKKMSRPQISWTFFSLNFKNKYLPHCAPSARLMTWISSFLIVLLCKMGKESVEVRLNAPFDMTWWMSWLESRLGSLEW